MTDEIKEALGLGEPCPLCSTENWEVYHRDGEPCPKAAEHPVTAFPASATTPGQRESRAAYRQLL